MKIAGIAYSNTKKRLLAVFLNLVVYVVFAFLLDYWVSGPTIKTWTKYYDYEDEYITVTDRYYELQDEYGIAAYDADGNRYIVTSIGDDVKENFKNNVEVKEILNRENQIEKRLILTNVLSFSAFFVLISLGFSILFSVIFGKYMSIGYVLVNQKILQESGEVPSTGKRIGFAVIRWLILYPLGLCTVLLLPISYLYQICYDENCQTKLEKKFKLICVLRSDL